MPRRKHRSSHGSIQTARCRSEAQGVREIPRLSGLSWSYLKRRLEDWSQGRDTWGTSMPKVARSLSPNQIAALASYLSFVGGESSEK
jgi:cytochrome c553